MRVVVVLLALLCVGFDHASHAQKIDVAGKPAVACTRCHEMRRGELVGKPLACTSCHAEGRPNAPDATDFVLQLGHARHAQLPKVTCASCHAAPDTPRSGAPHRRCSGCHDGTAGKGFALAECRGCHLRASDDPTPIRMALGAEAPFEVRTAFSHARHAARAPNGRACATCHPGIESTDARALPRPSATACASAGCHDNRAAFGVTRACTKCHQDAPTGVVRVARPSARFAHTLPAHAVGQRPCNSCHPLDARGQVGVAGHAACEGCHADDFLQRRPRTCGACHNSTEPWRALVADRLPAERTEFGASLDHGGTAHAATPCGSCHSLTTATVQLRPARGHVACTASGCHAATTGPAPRLDDCQACHELGLADQRDAMRRAAPWSTRARFDHAPHPVPCKTCHVDLSAKRTLELAAPSKSTCAPCHDGQKSFKLTGTTCTRCHPGPTK